MKGLFITFEGVDGCGKSSTMAKVAEELLSRGYNVMLTREPGGTQVAEKIRNIILYDDILPATEALLFAAARTEHTLKKIKPAVEEGIIVLSDRYIGSSLAYQGTARGLGQDNILAINDFGIDGYRPDIQFFLDVHPEVGFSRMGDRSKDRMESEPMDFYEAIYNHFKQNNLDYQICVNGERAQEEVVKEIVKDILDKLDSGQS